MKDKNIFLRTPFPFLYALSFVLIILSVVNFIMKPNSYNNSLSKNNYLEISLITNKYGVICLKNQMYLVSVYPPVGETKVYDGNKIISQFINDNGSNKCISVSYSESDVIKNPSRVYLYNYF